MAFEHKVQDALELLDEARKGIREPATSSNVPKFIIATSRSSRGKSLDGARTEANAADSIYDATRISHLAGSCGKVQGGLGGGIC